MEQKLNKLSQNKNSKNVFLNNGKSYQLSDLRKNIPLGNTLELISKKGVSEFYEGSIANDMVKSLNALGGLHTLEDFSKQKTIKSETISSGI